MGDAFQNILRKTAKAALSRMARLGLYGPLAAVFARGVRELSPPGQGRITVLALNSFRNMVDLTVLARRPDLRVLALDHEYQDALIGLFVRGGRNYKDPDFAAVYSEDERRQVADFLRGFLPVLFARLGGVDLLTSPNFYYRRDHFLVAACNAMGVATVAMFKEAFYADYYPDQKAEQFKRTGNAWGWVAIPNDFARRIALLSGAAAPERVVSCGILRMDDLLRLSGRPETPAPTAALFSFTHTVGLDMTTDPRWVAKCFFLDNEDEGFVRLFNAVHATFVRTARDNPRYRFVIKLLWEEPFKSLIREACRREGLDLEAVPNLTITTRDPIRWIREADVVIGSGSAVLLEGLAADRPVLFPLFAGREYNDHYYSHLPLNDKLAAEDKPTSPAEFSQRILAILSAQEKPRVRETYAPVISSYLGSLAPDALERHVRLFERAVEEARAARRA